MANLRIPFTLLEDHCSEFTYKFFTAISTKGRHQDGLDYWLRLAGLQTGWTLKCDHYFDTRVLRGITSRELGHFCTLADEIYHIRLYLTSTILPFSLKITILLLRPASIARLWLLDISKLNPALVYIPLLIPPVTLIRIIADKFSKKA